MFLWKQWPWFVSVVSFPLNFPGFSLLFLPPKDLGAQDLFGFRLPSSPKLPFWRKKGRTCSRLVCHKKIAFKGSCSTEIKDSNFIVSVRLHLAALKSLQFQCFTPPILPGHTAGGSDPSDHSTFRGLAVGAASRDS